MCLYQIFFVFYLDWAYLYLQFFIYNVFLFEILASQSRARGRVYFQYITEENTAIKERERKSSNKL